MTTATSYAGNLERDAYPQHIIFSDDDGIYWLRGKDFERAATLLRLACEGKSVGFAADEFWMHVRQLLAHGVTVGLIKQGRVSTIRPVPRERRSQASPAVPSTTVWIAPDLLFGQKELRRLERVTMRRSSLGAELVGRLRSDLAAGREYCVTDIGAVYVCQVGQDCYEVDWELTHIPPQVVEAVAVAAHQAGRSVRCQLVLPKARRGRKAKAGKPTIVVEQPVTYGQLRFPL